MIANWKTALILVLIALLEYLAFSLLISITIKSLTLDNSMTLQDYSSGSALLVVLSPGYFIASPIIGHYSDQFGRKKTLLFCMLLSTIGYSIILFGYNVTSIAAILSGVVLFSIGSSSLSIILAAITDISNNTLRAYFFALMMVAALIVLLTGQFSLNLLEKQTLNSLQDWNPLWLVIILKTLCLMIAVLFLPETKQIIVQKPRTSLPKFLLSLIAIFRNKILRRLLGLLLLAEIAWGLNYQNEFELLLNTFSLSPDQANSFLFRESLIMMLGLATLYPLLIKRYQPIKLLTIIATAFSLGGLIWLLSAPSSAKWLLNLPLCLASAMLTPLFWLMISNANKPKHNGLVMGIAQPIWSLGSAISALLSSSLANIDNKLPMIVASILMILLIILARRCR